MCRSKASICSTPTACMCPQVLTDYFAEDADVAFGIPEDSLLEIGLPYRLH